MRARLAKGVLNLSIEVLELDDREIKPLECEALRAAARLAELLAYFEMPATFAFHEPASSEMASRLAAGDRGHEIALLGDRSWLGADVGRGRLGRELAARVSFARQAGIDVRTIVLADDGFDEHHDLAVRNGIVALRAPIGRVDKAAAQPQALRFGLWGLPVAMRLPSARRWFGGGARAARAQVERAIDARGVVGLAIDARALAKRGALRLVERVLEHAARRRSEGTLDVLTLGDAASRLSAPAQSRPTRSILRPAA